MSTKQEVLTAEQAHFDSAWFAREASRETLANAGTAAGGPQKTAAAVKKAAQSAMDKLGGPDDQVAFGRIDIDGGPLYVGTHAIATEDMDLLVINWQAPAATPYYEASIDAPMGVTLRRTFTCDRNTITDFDDLIFEDLARRVAELTASDEERWGVNDALLRELESGRTGEMQEIVQTIHSAQHRLIRTPLDRLLVIQGGPGTGKTAVALHRVSWLLYNHAEDLKADDVLVIGPSDTFTKYIRGVLPGLGDDNVEHRDLRSLGPQRSTGRNELTSVRRVKGELRMADLLRVALWQRVRFPERTDTLEVGGGFGSPRFTKAEIEAELPNHLARGPYNAGRASFRRFLLREVEARSPRGVVITPATVEAALERVWPSLSPTAFLRDLLGSRDRLLAAAGDRFTAAEVGRLFRQASDKVSDEQWSDVDVALLDEADELLNGRGAVRFKHVVVDEAQDLSPMQLRSVRRRSADGSMTIVGDLAQSTGPWARNSWDEVMEVLQGDLEIVFEELELGYRVPRQVYELAARLLPYAAPGLTPPTVVRSGPADPDLVEAEEWDLVSQALTAARAHAGSGRFVGLICPDRHRRKLEEELTWNDVKWANVGAGHLDGSINVARPSEAKGLEFDAVVVIDPDAVVGESDWGLRHLYVALTRTTTYLTVVHTGIALPLPQDEAPSDALLEIAEVRGLEQQTLFPPPEPTTPAKHADVIEAAPAVTVQTPRTVAPAPAAGALGLFNQAIVDGAAAHLASEIRQALAPELWEPVLDELRRLLVERASGQD